MKIIVPNNQYEGAYSNWGWGIVGYFFIAKEKNRLTPTIEIHKKDSTDFFTAQIVCADYIQISDLGELRLLVAGNLMVVATDKYKNHVCGLFGHGLWQTFFDSYKNDFFYDAKLGCGISYTWSGSLVTIK